jgi:hypothetical protein
MLTKKKLPLLVASIICLEIAIYLWAVWTSTLDKSNFFAIEPEFIFDKCARNSGRVSSTLNLIILLMIGYFGLKQIYHDGKKRDKFRILITLFAVNHLVHFFFVFQTFKHHTMALDIFENKHGFITFICIQLIPIILWTFKKLTTVLYISIILHLFNVSYFIMETFYNKIKPDKPAYHNQFGIAVTTAACIYILYRVFREYKSNPILSGHHDEDIA